PSAASSSSRASASRRATRSATLPPYFFWRRASSASRRSTVSSLAGSGASDRAYWPSWAPASSSSASACSTSARAAPTPASRRSLGLRQGLPAPRAPRPQAGGETLGLAERREGGAERIHRRRLARVDAGLGTSDEAPEPLGVHQARALARELRVLTGNGRRLL